MLEEHNGFGSSFEVSFVYSFICVFFTLGLVRYGA